MKNKIIYIFLFFAFFANPSISEEDFYNFETKEIKILDNGNIINAKNGKVTSRNDEFEVIANNFQYFRDTQFLKISGVGNILFKENNLKIEFDKADIDQKKQLLKVYGDVVVINSNESIKISSKEIIYNFDNDIIYSLKKSKIRDNFENSLNADNFHYDIDKNLLKLNSLVLKDKFDNIFKTSIAYLNTKTNNLYGKDVHLNLGRQILNPENEPRMKGNSIKNTKNSMEISKGVFTTCKKRDGCPPWQISAKKINHDKIKKIISYDDAFLQVYNVPVIYLPKFSHPDPTVKRQSGFLSPYFKSSNNKKNYFGIPYFFVISDNKDATFSPRIYDKEFLLQTEYRQKNFKSDHISDFSLKVNDESKLRGHFFYSYKNNININNFNESNIDFHIQKTSKDTYIKKNKIKSDIIVDESLLENSFNLELAAEDLTTNVNTTVYENLDREDSDRFEYIIPKINIEKKFRNSDNLGGEFLLKSELITRNYNTNVFETVNINDLFFESNPSISRGGFYNNYEFIIKNSNSKAQNSKIHKNKNNINLTSIFQFNSSLPMVKNSQYFQKTFKPKLSIKAAPDYTKDIRSNYKKFDTNNIYSINRFSENNSSEGGISMTYGGDYSIYNKKKFRELLNFKVANNIRFDDQEDLPGNNQLNQKTSNIFSEISFTPNEIINIKYDTAIKNNLSDLSYENLITSFNINNIVTSFDYLNENNTLNNNSYLSNSTEFRLDDNYSLSFSTRKNKTINLTEYYNLAYEYKNDCLSASLEYNKQYYNDRDVKPNESVIFKFSIIPE